jgi:tetratricopeptide (TPR) repeat protein
MSKKLGSGLLCILTAILLTTGCQPKSPPQASGYFQTSFQSESQFIVEAIVSDLAEQIYYAANHRLPEKKYFSVSATETADSTQDVPVYELRINLDRKHAGLKFNVKVQVPIWSPDVYGDLAAALAQAVRLKEGSAENAGDTALLSKLLDGTPETIERENQSLSESLEKNFSNPELHEQAALLLGAFLLRDHSGNFFEIRSPLSRLTAHLVMARWLNNADSYGVNGRLAEATLLTLVNDQALALEKLASVDTNHPAVAGLARALRARNTGDYRPLAGMTARSQVESAAWFAALANFVSASSAWVKLDEEQRQNIDFVRIANEAGYSVEMGHELLQFSIPLELQEIQSVYGLSRHGKLSQSSLITALNELPEYGFSTGADHASHVQVISWGQWALFFQRHLCHALQQNFHFMQYQWGVPDDAREFAVKCEQTFGGLRLYPFVRRFNCTEVEAYHRSVDDGFKVTVATPHLVPAECWNYLCYKPSFAPLYCPNPNPHINEWHSHNPPPGTVYDLHPRLNHPSLIDRPDAVARFEQLHAWAPYDCRIAHFILAKKYNQGPTYGQALAFYGELLPYSVYALETMADTAYDQPERYEMLMLQAAELNPAYYYNLGDYALAHHHEDKAAEYTDKACDLDPDSVRVSNHARWRVDYYLRKGQTDKAREIADFAGEVYSAAGLTAKASFLEQTTNYDGAFEWYAKNEERYKEPGPLLAFCARYKAQTGDSRFDVEVQKRSKTIFPGGMEPVSLNNFQAAPTDGAVFQGQNDVMRSFGFKRGDVIVAVGGIRTHTFAQYSYARELSSSPELDLIVWQGDSYHEIKASLSNHRFGVNMGDYKPN